MLSKMFTSVVFVAIAYTGMASACCYIGMPKSYKALKIKAISCQVGMNQYSTIVVSNGETNIFGNEIDHKFTISQKQCYTLYVESAGDLECNRTLTADIDTEAPDSGNEFVRNITNKQVANSGCR